MKRGILMAVGLVLALTISAANAQKIDFEFQIYSGDEKIIDALQSRLIQGGEPAKQAAEKLPDFVRSRRLTLEVELKFQATSGDRSKHASSQKTITVHREDQWVETDGLAMEMDPVATENGLIDVNLNPLWTRKAGRDIQLFRLTNAVTARSGEPVLLTRWLEEDVQYLFMMTATSGQPGTSSTDDSQSNIYTESTFYETNADAQAKRDPVAKVVFPSRSGQRAKVEIIVPLIYETDGGLNSCNVGLTTEIDPVSSNDGKSARVAVKLEYLEKTGGTERTANGDRVPKVAVQQVSGQSEDLAHGESKALEPKKSSIADPNKQPSDWRASIGVLLPGN